MAEGNPKNPKSPTKELSDSDTSEDEQVNPMLRTSRRRKTLWDYTWFSIGYTDSTQLPQGSI